MKKKFGLSLACKIAAQTIEKNMVAPSIVISNLFILEKSSEFPDNLDEIFFTMQKIKLSDDDVRRTRAILDAFKAPGAQKYDVLMTAVSENWTEKKKQPSSFIRQAQNLQRPERRFVPRKKAEKQVAPPVVIVKKKIGL